MSLRVVIVGPGRVGAACGRRLAAAGVDVIGYVGRDTASTAAALQFAGVGRALTPADHPTAHAVLFAVGDSELESAVAALLAAAPPRRCSLWLHTSGRHGLAIFDAAAAAGARRGAIHPVSPFADAESGYVRMQGQPAVVLSDDNSRRLLRQIVRRLGMVAIEATDRHRDLYHAACALAANGLVALRGVVDEMFAGADSLTPCDARQLADALMHNALAGASDVGAAAALSGPVLRGDRSTVEAHLAALAASAPAARPVYRALMLAALELARARGLSASAAEALQALLEDPSEP